MDTQRRYWTYLVRLWPVRGNGTVVWRASILDVHTGATETFAEPDQIVQFLAGVVQQLPRELSESAASCRQADDEELHADRMILDKKGSSRSI